MPETAKASKKKPAKTPEVVIRFVPMPWTKDREEARDEVICRIMNTLLAQPSDTCT